MKVRIATKEGVYTLLCYKTDIPGLVVHRRSWRLEPEIMYYANSWVITHLDSGHRVPILGMKTRRAAREVATRLSAIDWTRGFTEINVPENRDIIYEAKGGYHYG